MVYGRRTQEWKTVLVKIMEFPLVRQKLAYMRLMPVTCRLVKTWVPASGVHGCYEEMAFAHLFLLSFWEHRGPSIALHLRLISQSLRPCLSMATPAWALDMEGCARLEASQ